MRLWHEALIPQLSRQRLLGQHRECCALRGRGWGKPHATVNYVFTHSYGLLVMYHRKVMEEMQRRGYSPDPKWWRAIYHGEDLGNIWDPEVLQCITIKTAYLTQNPNALIYPEHDEAYLRECLDNLAGKGIHITMEAAK